MEYMNMCASTIVMILYTYTRGIEWEYRACVCTLLCSIST